MKKLFALITVLLWSVAVYAQTHTVARGESLRSIAAKYNISEAQLIEANPEAAKLFYVGLKLNIPTPSAISVAPAPSGYTQRTNNTGVETIASDEKKHNEKKKDDAISNISTDEDKPGTEFTMMLEYGFLPKVSGIRGTNYTYAVTIGGNYYFMHHNSGVFAGARIGYNSANYNGLISDGRGSYITTTTNTHFITLPIQGGYSFTTSNRKFGLTPYAGIGFNFCVGGKSKMKGYSHGSSSENEVSMKKKVGIDARLGLQLRLWGFNLGASYVIPLNKNQEAYFGDDSYFAINIGFGF